ncbi:MAG: hypothetical protein QOG94_3153 [Solirubrobacteraceae bacterium]|nr:hypothetical protein [Solirubrobacteraceae bacterium]
MASIRRMTRPVVGIYASAAPASWGPWRDRPSALVPAALGTALQRAGAIVVLLAPDPGLDEVELLDALDALIAFDAGDAEHVAALREAAGEIGLALLVLDAATMTPDSPVEQYEREIDGLLTAP